VAKKQKHELVREEFESKIQYANDRACEAQLSMESWQKTRDDLKARKGKAVALSKRPDLKEWPVTIPFGDGALELEELSAKFGATYSISSDDNDLGIYMNREKDGTLTGTLHASYMDSAEGFNIYTHQEYSKLHTIEEVVEWVSSTLRGLIEEQKVVAVDRHVARLAAIDYAERHLFRRNTPEEPV